MSASDTPLLSILIPTWNRVDEVLRAIDSVGDRSGVVEIVVVDNASPGEVFGRLCRETARYPQVRLFRNEKNLGMVRNWNSCIAHAKGTWLGLLCSDDEYAEGAIERACSLLARTQFPSLVIQSPDIDVHEQCAPPGAETVRALKLPIASGNFWHREISERIGGFDERFEYSADAEFWYRVASRYPVIKVREPFARYNIHGDNYMWATWERDDFLQQTELLAQTVQEYTRGPEADGEAAEAKINADLWATLTTILTNTALKPGKERLFGRYVAIALRRADSGQRKLELAGLIANLFRARLKQGLKRSLGRG